MKKRYKNRNFDSDAILSHMQKVAKIFKDFENRLNLQRAFMLKARVFPNYKNMIRII